MHNAYLCRICKHEDGIEFIWRTIPRRNTHFRLHKDQGGWSPDEEIPIMVQSFSSADSTRRDFQVSPSLISASQHTADSANPIVPHEASVAFVGNFSNSKPKAAEGQATLKEAEPFIVISGWGDFSKKHNIRAALEHLVKPDSGPMNRIYRTAYPMFLGFMEALAGMHGTIRRHVTDETAR